MISLFFCLYNFEKVYENKENISNDTTIFVFSKKSITWDEIEGAELQVVDENDNTHLVPNPETAPVVKMIFEMYDSGKRTTYISNYLEKNKVVIPVEYFYRIWI